MKISYLALLAVIVTLCASGGRAEAYIGYGYRANEPVRVDRCYRGLAWNYGVPFYIVGPNQKKCVKYREFKKSRK